MNSIKMRGILTDKFPQKQVSDRLITRAFWIKEPDTERYPQHWELELHNDECRRIDEFKEGDQLEAEVELRGRKYDKGNRVTIFNSLKCIGLKKLAGSVNPFKK